MENTKASTVTTISIEEIERHIREVPDFPKPGISFKDITPLLENGPVFQAAVDSMVRATEKVGYDLILSAEALRNHAPLELAILGAGLVVVAMVAWHLHSAFRATPANFPAPRTPPTAIIDGTPLTGYRKSKETRR